TVDPNHELLFFFFSSRRRHTRFSRDWSSDVCSSDLDDRDDGRQRRAETHARWGHRRGMRHVLRTVFLHELRELHMGDGWGLSTHPLVCAVEDGPEMAEPLRDAELGCLHLLFRTAVEAARPTPKRHPESGLLPHCARCALLLCLLLLTHQQLESRDAAPGCDAHKEPESA